MVAKRLSWSIVTTLLLAAAVSCSSDSNGDGNGTNGDTGVQGDAADSIVTLESELVGFYAFDSATTENGTLTTRYQDAPIAGQPDRQVMGSGALIVRQDGTWDRVLNMFQRESSDAEPTTISDGPPEIDGGTWSVVNATLTVTEEGEGPKDFTYGYAEGTGLLTLDIVEPEEGTPEQMVWRRHTVMVELLGAYDLISTTFLNGATVTGENSLVGTDQWRGEGTLEVLPDGLFVRHAAFYVNDQLAEEDEQTGMWFAEGSELIIESAGETPLYWDFSYDSATGTFTQNSVDPAFEVQQLVWQRQAE